MLARHDVRFPEIHELTAIELGAWRGMLRVHAPWCASSTRSSSRRHGLPLTSYDVLINLRGRPAGGSAWPSSPTACC